MGLRRYCADISSFFLLAQRTVEMPCLILHVLFIEVSACVCANRTHMCVVIECEQKIFYTQTINIGSLIQFTVYITKIIKLSIWSF